MTKHTDPQHDTNGEVAGTRRTPRQTGRRSALVVAATTAAAVSLPLVATPASAAGTAATETVAWGPGVCPSYVAPDGTTHTALYQTSGGYLNVFDPSRAQDPVTGPWRQLNQLNTGETGGANALAFSEKLGKVFSIRPGDQDNDNGSDIGIRIINQDGTAVRSLTVKLPKSFKDDGQFASAGYDDETGTLWAVSTLSRNIFYRFNIEADLAAANGDWTAVTPTYERYDFGMYYGSGPTLARIFPGGHPNPGGTQYTDLVVIGTGDAKRMYLLSDSNLFEFNLSPATLAKTLVPAATPVTVKGIATPYTVPTDPTDTYKVTPLVNQAITNTSDPAWNPNFPRTGTFGSLWAAKTPEGHDVLYASNNQNQSIPAGFTAGLMFRIDDPGGTPSGHIAGQARVTAGSDGFSCSGVEAPYALEVEDDLNYTPVNTQVTGSWIANDVLWDAQLDPSKTTQPSHGTAVVNADGTYTYTPNADFRGTDTFTYTVCTRFGTDGTQDCATAMVTIIVDGPIANNDDVTTPFETATSGTVAGNDDAPAGSVFTLQSPPSTSAGAITFEDDGTWTFQPADGFSGKVSYDYQVCAPSPFQDACATAKLTITVTPEGADDDRTTPLNQAVTIDVVANDPAQGLTVDSITQPSHGTAEIVDGKVVYTPAKDWSGVDTFTYLAKDATGQSVEQKVTIHVTPLGADDEDVTPLDTPKTLDVLANDPSGPNLTLESLTQPSHGTAEIVDGKVVYTPSAGWSGTDTFTYLAKDAAGQSVEQKVTIHVTPQGRNDIDTTPLNTPKDIDVLANDPSGPNLTVMSVSAPSHGTAVVNSAGGVTYTPAKDWSGVDTFEYVAHDASGQPVTQTVTVTVTPAGADDLDATPLNTPKTLDVLANDPSGPNLTLVSVTQPSHGTAEIVDGKVVYTPAKDWSGTDTFTYTAKDAAGQSVEQKVTITVTPEGKDDEAKTAYNTATDIAVLANDPSGAHLTVKTTTDPGHGTVAIQPDGTIRYTPTPGFSGLDTFTYTATDEAGQPVTQTVRVLVAPAGSDDRATTPLNTAVKIDVLANDPSKADITVTSVTAPGRGTAVVNPDGTVTYTPADGFSGQDTFTYTAVDGHGQTVTQKVTVTVTPAGTDDATTTQHDTPKKIDVLANDPSGPNLVLDSVSKPAHGTATVESDGTVLYTPDPRYSGTDTFTYVALDRTGQPVEQKVTVTVTPEGVDDTATTKASEPVDIDVLANELTDGLTVTTITQPSHGTSVLNADGTVTYTPADGFSGKDTFTYTAKDSAGQIVTQKVTVTVTPAGADDHATTPFQTPRTIDVVANDPTTGLTVQSVTTPGHGTAVVDPAGTVTYTPAKGFSGTDTFRYTATDALGQSVTQTVTVVVAPKGADDQDITSTDTPVTIDVLANDPTDGLTVQSVTTPGHGTATPNPDGTITYTPAPGYSGFDRFTYTAVDAEGQKVTQNVDITVTPKGTDDTATTPFETPKKIDVLANDPSTGLEVSEVTQGGHGSVVVNADGTVTYTPENGFSGLDRFTYTAVDAAGQKVTQTVTVSVAPKGGDDVAVTPMATPVDIDVLANDPATNLTVTTVATPGHGTATANPDGTVRYTPDAGFSGIDTFTYTATDSTGQTITQKVTVTVTPKGVDDTAATDYGTPVKIDVLANDPATTLQVTATTDPGHGTIVVNPDGTITYTPEAGFSGTDTFRYTATDSAGQKVTQTVTVLVRPAGSNDAETTPTDTPVTLDVLANDPVDDLTITSVSTPSHGTAISDGGGLVTYTPEPGFSGKDTFTYTATDPEGQKVVQTVTITVTPVGADDKASTPSDTAVKIPVLSNDPTTGLTVTTTTPPGHGTVVVDPDGAVTYTPQAGFSGTDTFTYTAKDSTGQAVTQNVTVTVTPRGADDAAATGHNTPVDIPVLANDPTKGLTVTGTTDPGHGTVSVGSGGVVTYTPEPGFSGKDTFTYTATDSSGEKVTQNVVVTVVPTGLDDVAGTTHDTPVDIPVLANDPTKGLTVTGTTDPGHGTVSVGSGGVITYTPEPGFSGKDTFTYTATDSSGQKITQTVTVTVSPSGGNDLGATPFETPVTIPVLANDPTTGLTVTGTSTPGHGTTTVNPDGTITYTPEKGFTGTDTFTYTAKDPAGQTITQTVTVTVTPAGRDDQASTGPSTPVTIPVLTNDPTPGLTVTGTSTPGHGTTTVNPDGTITYTPDTGFSGTDTFTYTAKDPSGQTITQTVTVVVRPDGRDDNATTPIGTPVKIDVLANDPSTGLTVTSVTPPKHGTATINPDGTVTYRPKPGFSGVDTFTYTATNADGQTVTRTVTVTVTPAGVVDTASTPANTPVVIDVLGNDPAGPSVTVVSVTNGDHGTVVINPDGTVTYTPDRGFAGDDTFTYTACDADDQCYERTVTVTIAGDVDQETVTSTTTPGGSSSGSGSGTSGGSSSGGTTGGGSTSGSGSATDRSASTLARTGSDMAPIASLGLTLSAAGAAIMAAARRRRRSA